MATRLFEAGVLFGVAVDAATSIKAVPRAGGQKSALVSIVFSVVSLEAFFSEIAEAAQDKFPPDLEPEEISIFAEVMADAEAGHASLEAKFTLANWILARRKLNKSSQPYQDFALLMRLRNDLVHYKANNTFESKATSNDIHQDLIRRFRSKKILADDWQPNLVSWTYIIQTKAVAEWSCRTAAQMVGDLCSAIPAGSGFKSLLEMLQRNFEAQYLRSEARKK